ncbi:MULTISPECIES: enoyl-CoA hydratase/isomerase family protein [Pandoraea]|uniref:enoyl-CoA hydratase/isomerase family protein n=1 Tax=Pandoraea TaxID=93217 RepID=UPI001F5DE4D5|nr:MULTISPECIES: enoyl-CoA hydratase/isomerase family protein [Pandoraea]MCI3206476.1 enoyl-CoA hydratase [Pandoraea sp. LA3]MDN4584504.1 enoyl-CoA hydratase [Pandoraea capi]
MTYQTLDVDVTDRVATIWLNRPDVRNALNETVIAELDDALKRLGERDDVRVIVLAGRGKAFSAGADLQWMQRMATYSASENEADAMRLAAMLQTLNDCPKPTVARVHGAAFAGGMGLVAACDIVVAATTVEFCLSEVRIGLVPATISPYIVQKLGAAATRRYMLTAERISAAEAHWSGWVHAVCAPEEIDASIGKFTTALLAGGPAALAQSKALIGAVENQPIDGELIARTAKLIANVRASAEGREGVDAFLHKRTAEWVSQSFAGEAR